MSPNRKPKLLIFINSLNLGGAERVVSHLLKNLEADFDLHLALYSRQIEYEIPKSIPVFDLGQSLDENPFTIFLKIPLLAYRLHRYCKQNEIQTSVAFLNRPCYINAVMRSLFGFKGQIIMCERTHQSTILSSNSWLFRKVSSRLVKYSYNRANLVLVNSYASKYDLQKNFKVRRPMQVIYNPVDIHSVQRLSNEPTDFVFDPNCFHFISVGGFRKEKNLHILLDAFFIIKHLPVKLVLVGSGALHKELEQKVHDLDLTEKVVFIGFDANPYKYVRQSDCFVLSSFVEGFPNVLLEALACEKPIISTDCKSGPRELLAPESDLHHSVESSFELAEYGVLTPVNDVAIMASAMKRMYEDKTLRDRYAQKAMSRARQFDVDEIIQFFHVAFSGL